MVNITRGSASIEEIEEMTSSKGRLTTVYAKYSSDARKDGDYAFSDSIRHPDTGELLKPVKGYCTSGSSFGRPCYYAEYEGKSGTYYYFDQTKYYGSLPNAMTIREQLDEDRSSYLKNFSNKDSEEDYQGKTDNITDENFDGEDVTGEDYDITPGDFDDEDMTKSDYQGETDNVTDENFDEIYMGEEDSDYGESKGKENNQSANGQEM